MEDKLIVSGGSGQYTKYTLSVSGANYKDIHVFKTMDGQSIAPMVSASLIALENMNPTGISAANVLAKTNAGMYNANEKEFYGIYYLGQGKPLYVNGKKYYTPPEPSSNENEDYTNPKFWPSFCVKTDGTAMIRWFTSPAQISAAMKASDCIIAAAHPIIFGGKNIFMERVMDGAANGNRYVLYDSDEKNVPQRFQHYVGVPFTNKARTMLGHVQGSKGVYVMVCARALTLRNGAKVMKLLGCDYAVALDGGSPSQMRVKGVGEVVGGNHDKIFTGVCAYKT